MIKTIKKFNYLLSKKDLKTLLFIIFFLLIGMILEIIGISLIVPLIDYLTDSELAMKSVFFKKLKNFFIVNDNLIIFYFLSIILLIFFLKTIVLVFINFKQNLFVQKLIARISNNLFSMSVSKSYNFY